MQITLLHTLSMEISLIHASLLTPLLLLLLLPLYLLSCHRKIQSNGHGGHGNSIPSPPALPVLGHLHLLKKPLHRSLAALAARYGGGSDGAGLLRLRFGARPVLLVSSPSIAEECFTVHDVALADRPGIASRRLLTGGDCPSIATASYGPLWRHLRRISTVHVLSAHRLSLTTAVRDAEARAMAWRFWRAAGPGATVVSVKSTAYEFVVNVIMTMVAGRRMPEDEVLRFKVMTEATMAAGGSANRQDFLPFLKLLDFGRTGRRLAGLSKERHEFGQSLIDEYRRLHHHGEAESTVPDDMLAPPTQRTVIGDLIRQQEQSPESYTDVVIRTVCLSLLQGGTDTSSSTIEWAMALLLNYPDVLVKATKEIDAVVGMSRLVEERDLACLPYLRCIITETLRMYPLAPHLTPHQASCDCVVTGRKYVIPRGTMVLVDVYSMQRDPALWEDSNRFKPERFCVSNDTVSEGDGKPLMMPFGMGRRKCPGEGLAWRTVGVALGVMIQCFKWERAEKEKVDMSEGSGFTMSMAMPLVAMYRPREEMDAVLKSIKGSVISTS